MRMTTGEEIRRQRKRLKMSQTQLAKRLDVSKSTIVRWECGEREPPLARVLLEFLSDLKEPPLP